MTYRGKVLNGVVVLEPGGEPLRDGTVVRVETVDEPATADTRRLWEGLMKLAGVVDGCPEDLAENHDHYAYGAPKRRRAGE